MQPSCNNHCEDDYDTFALACARSDLPAISLSNCELILDISARGMHALLQRVVPGYGAKTLPAVNVIATELVMYTRLTAFHMLADIGHLYICAGRRGCKSLQITHSATSWPFTSCIGMLCQKTDSIYCSHSIFTAVQLVIMFA